MLGNIISVLIAFSIIAYAIYTIYKNMKLQAQGKCSSCSKDCTTCDISNIKTKL